MSRRSRVEVIRSSERIPYIPRFTSRPWATADFIAFESASTIYYRALGLPVPGGVHWFWMGTHAEYDKLVG